MSQRKQCKSVTRTPAHIRELELYLNVTFTRIERTRGGHLKLWLQNIPRFFVVAQTPSDRRWLYNAASNIRQALRTQPQ